MELKGALFFAGTNLSLLVSSTEEAYFYQQLEIQHTEHSMILRYSAGHCMQPTTV